jgi:hypothetical protein
MGRAHSCRPAVFVLVVAAAALLDVGTVPAYLPRPDQGIFSEEHPALSKDICAHYKWGLLSDTDARFHAASSAQDLRTALATTVREWGDKLFHLWYDGRTWRILHTPTKCMDASRVCWGRAEAVLETLVEIATHDPNLLVGGVDVLYSPWDEPLNISTYPVWQYNRRHGDFGVIVPYHYAFNGGQLDMYRAARRTPSSGRFRGTPRCPQGSSARDGNKDDRAVFRGSATYADSFETSSRGKLCSMLADDPKGQLRSVVDVAIVEGAPEESYCGRTHRHVSLLDQASCYTMMLDIEGQSFFTDRTATVVLLNTTLIRQARDGDDFLIPFYLRPWEHYVPTKHDFQDLEAAVMWVRSHRREAALLNSRSSQVGLRRTTDEAVLCAYRSALEPLARWGSLTTEKEDDGDPVQPSGVWWTVLWERPGNGNWRLFVNVPGDPRKCIVVLGIACIWACLTHSRKARTE